MLSLLNLGLSEHAEKPRFGSFNLNKSEIFRLSFEDIFWNTRHLYEKNEPTLGSFGGGGGSTVISGWLITYKFDITNGTALLRHFLIKLISI